MPKFLKNAAVRRLVLPEHLARGAVEREDVVVVRRHVELAADRERVRLLPAAHVRVELLEVERVGALPSWSTLAGVISVSGESRLLSAVRPKPSQSPAGIGARCDSTPTHRRDSESDHERAATAARSSRSDARCCRTPADSLRYVRMRARTASTRIAAEEPRAARAPRAAAYGAERLRRRRCVAPRRTGPTRRRAAAPTRCAEARSSSNGRRPPAASWRGVVLRGAAGSGA